jgi:hypothetical protein
MNNYKIYLIDGNDDYALLDVEDLESFTTTFSISDISNIGSRKDSISKNIKLKGTKNNNRIFGNLYSIDRDVDETFVDNLFVYYKPNKTVQSVVYENDILTLKGNLQVTQVSIDKNNLIEYTCLISGSVISLFSLIGTKKLEDLDFSDLKHTYNFTSINQSWTAVKGDRFVYPFILYKGFDGDQNKIYFDNFRPALYVREIFNKMFEQVEGYSYEIKGSDTFLEEFNSLIIPDNSEKLYTPYTGVDTYAITVSKTTPTLVGSSVQQITTGKWKQHIINFDSVTDSRDLFTMTPYMSNINNRLIFDRETIVDGSVSFNVSVTNKNNPKSVKFSIVLAEADKKNTVDTDLKVELATYSNIVQQTIADVAPNSTYSNTNFTLQIPTRTFEANKQMMMYLQIEGEGAIYTSTFIDYTISSATMHFPSLPTNLIRYTAKFGDEIVPQAPLDITQSDFIKSILKMYNFYVYSSLEEPKHIIFEKYDDFYSAGISGAKDWSDKIDYTGTRELKMNTDSNKLYSFSYKDDSDYANSDLYKKRYNLTYGNYDNGSDGVAKEEKIEVIFSPTPSINTTGSTRIQPVLYTMSSDNTTSRFKSNIRIVYYNGVKSSNPYTIVDASGGTLNSNIVTYGNCGHLLYASGDSNYDIKADLNFGLCREYFSQVNQTIYDAPNLFTNYKNLIYELNDPNFVTIELDMLLNPVDISSLDFRTPVYISTPSGNAYFKLLEVNYQNANEVAKVKLQKILVY